MSKGKTYRINALIFFFFIFIVSRFTKTQMRDATECINLIGYVLFAVIKAIISNPYGLEMIMNYIYKLINKIYNRKSTVTWRCNKKHLIFSNSELKIT